MKLEATFTTIYQCYHVKRKSESVPLMDTSKCLMTSPDLVTTCETSEEVEIVANRYEFETEWTKNSNTSIFVTSTQSKGRLIHTLLTLLIFS